MIFGPMTFLVACVLAVCLIGGAWILMRSVAKGASGEPQSCPKCRSVNPARAKFCASCGQALGAAS